MTTIGDEVTSERLEEILAGCDGVTMGPWMAGHLCRDDHTCNCRYISGNDGRMGAVASVHVDDGENDCPPTAEAKANQAHIARLDPETVRSIVTELLSRRSTAVGSTPSEGEVVAHFDTLDSCLESFWCSTNEGSDNRILADQAIASAKALRAAAQVRANSEGDGGAVKGLDDVLSSAMACDQWPDWLSQIVDQTNEAADTSDMSTEQAVAFGILSALSLQPITGEAPPSQALRDRVEEQTWGEWERAQQENERK